MKTKDLIAKLQEADPTGELECCVGNVDIHFVEKLPAYYDGPLQVLTRDMEREGKCYNITGAKVFQTGGKVQIHTLSIREMFFDNPDAPVEYIWPPEEQYRTGLPRQQALVDGWRKEAKE